MVLYPQDVPHTATMAGLFCFPTESFLIHPTKLSGGKQQTPSSEAGETWKEWLNFSYEAFLFTALGIFNLL